MTYAQQALKRSYETNTQKPVLPANMQRSDVEGLLSDVGKYIGMSSELIHSTIKMIRETRPNDWINPDTEPYCFAMQSSIAAKLNKTTKAVRNDESALAVRWGFIIKDTAANGSRFRQTRKNGDEFKQGLCFTPLIELVPSLLAQRDLMETEREDMIRLKRKCSALRGAVKKTLAFFVQHHPECEALKVIQQTYESWPRRYLEIRTLDALEEHYNDVLVTSEAVDSITSMLEDSSCQSEVSFLPYIQDTTEETLVKSNTSVNKRTDCNQSDANLSDDAPKGTPSICLENKHDVSNDDDNLKFLSKLTPSRLFELASTDMQLYILKYQKDRTAPSPTDFMQAAIDMLRELGINKSAYKAAVEAMGEMKVAWAILIIDRNQNHPDTPIKSPGGVLRAMTTRHLAGKLNLAGSLIGLMERQHDT